MDSSELGTIATYNPFTITPETPLLEAARLVDELKIYQLPVIDDDGRLVGMLSDGDLLSAVGERSLAVSVAGPFSFDKTFQDFRVSDAMTRRVVTIPHQTRPAEALRLLLQYDLHSAPVVDGERLIGIVSTTDFMRELSYGTTHFSREPVSRFVQKPREPISWDDSLDTAAETMKTNETDYVVVERGDLPLGVLSRRTAHATKYHQVFANLQGRPIAEMPVGQLMSSALICRPSQRLCDAVGIMVEGNSQALAVVNQANSLMGVISESALLRDMLSNYDAANKTERLASSQPVSH